MASDEDYASFLEKANQDPSAGTAAKSSSSNKMQFKATDSGANIPKAIKAKTDNEEWIYTSDADEPFVPVSLKLYSGSKLPDERKSPPGIPYHDDSSQYHIRSKNKTPGLTANHVDSFAKLISHPSPSNADIEILDASSWDSAGQYKDVVAAVKEACGGGDVKVYRVAHGGTRVEYWVVGLHEGRVVGVKALGVES